MNFTEQEQRSVIWYLTSESVKINNISGRMATEYGDICVSNYSVEVA
jgi:hypothetical protein